MSKFITHIIFFASMILLSCDSPMDIDTPRKPIPKIINPVQLDLVEFSVESNGIMEDYNLSSFYAKLDTSSLYNMFWCNITISTEDPVNFDDNRLHISSLLLIIDSLAVIGSTQILKDGPDNKPFASFLVNRGISSIYDTTVYSDSIINIAEVKFSLDEVNNNVWLYLDAKIYENRVLRNADSLENSPDYVPDSLFYKVNFKFSFS